MNAISTLIALSLLHTCKHEKTQIVQTDYVNRVYYCECRDCGMIIAVNMDKC